MRSRHRRSLRTAGRLHTSDQIARSTRSVIESLETRRLLTSYVVDTAVDETNNASTTSLRDAILAADANSGDDDITFDATVFPSGSTTTIPLTQGALQFIAPTFGKITIDGGESGGRRVKVSGGDASRVFYITNMSNVELKHITIADGFHNLRGGGIYNEAKLLLQDVIVRDNNVTGDAGTGIGSGGNVSGGGLYNATSGTVTIDKGFFTKNEAIGGTGRGDAGGITGGGSGQGAAIATLGGLTIDDTDIAFNNATGGNGGEFPGSAGADGGWALGGGIFADTDSVVDLSGVTFTGNLAVGGLGGGADGTLARGDGGEARGGAIESLTDDFNIDTTRTEFMFNSNIAQGGAAGNGNSTTLGVGGDGLGGAIYNDGHMLVTDQGFGGQNADGGFSAGQAGRGMGGAVYNNEDMTLVRCDISQNAAGGGFASSDNQDGGLGAGGGVANAGEMHISQSRIALNQAHGGSSSAGNGGSGQGGGVWTAVDLRMTDTTITHNSATSGDSGDGLSSGHGGVFAGGGAIFIDGLTTVRIDRSTLDNNTVTGGAGGDGGTFAGDGGGGLGGAIFNEGDTTLRDSTLYGNAATGGAPGSSPADNGNGGGASGGAINQTIGGTLTAINVTIAHNSATGVRGGTSGFDGRSGGGGIENNFPLVSLTNTIIADNLADAGPDLRGDFLLKNSLVSTPPDDYTPISGSANNKLDTPAGLGPLADNGGPTQTTLLLPGSAAIDAGDDAAATTEFGADGTDQRGDGFPRFVGAHVDIGAIENQGPAIVVSGNGKTIANGDTTPSTSDFTNFGSAAQGASPLQRTFVIANHGEDNLNISDITLPGGYSLVGAVPTPIAPGDSGTVTIRLSTANVGTFTGNVVIKNNDNSPPADANFTFRVTGTITSTTPPPSNGAIRINFEPAGRPVPATYLADTGAVFGNRGNGQTYGWNLSASSFTRDRNINSDQRKDTLVHTQLFGSRTWEIQVPNGTYQVHLVAGDPQYFDSVYKINVEGVLTINGTPSSGNRFFEATKNVVVTDGRLTISNASGAVNNKLDYVDITRVIAINFQPSGRPVPAGYFADTGSTFGSRGNGFSYGWNSSASSFTRDRDLLSDQRLDTLVHTQLFGVRTWDLAVPNGAYSVFITAGDPRYFDSVYRFNVEGQLTVNGTPTSGNRFVSGTKTVTVSDGKLTITNASGSVNNKLAFIEVTPV